MRLRHEPSRVYSRSDGISFPKRGRSRSQQLNAALAETPDILEEFQGIIRRRAVPELDAWLDRVSGSLVAALANGILKDRNAVQAAMTSAWSNGQTEGQICKLKLVKRQMYGRAKIDLLKARLLGAA